MGFHDSFHFCCEPRSFALNTKLKAISSLFSLMRFCSMSLSYVYTVTLFKLFYVLLALGLRSLAFRLKKSARASRDTLPSKSPFELQTLALLSVSLLPVLIKSIGEGLDLEGDEGAHRESRTARPCWRTAPQNVFSSRHQTVSLRKCLLLFDTLWGRL